MVKQPSPRLLDNAFFIGVIGKALGGLVEFLVALGLIFVSVATLQHWAAPLNRFGIHAAQGITSRTEHFAIFYFGSRGVLRIGLAVALLKEQLWAYPVTLVFLGASIIYQTDLIIHHFSSGLVLLTLFDLIVVALTMYEYRKLKGGGHLNYPHL